jgi:signal transduction histidine kinase/DNA-binding response OmpR family regulator
MADEHILIADDEPDVLDTCSRVLALQGYQVTVVHSGFEAIEMAKKQDFDLLLTDIKMPGMSGLEAFHAIKQLRPDIVGVAVTGHGAVDTAIEALKLGMDDFLLKPFALDTLRGAIGKALEKKRLARENARLKALIPLFELSQAFMSVTDLDVLLRQVMQMALQETHASLGVLTLENKAGVSSEACVVVSDDGASSPDSACKLSSAIVRRAVQSREAVLWQVSSGQGSFLELAPGDAEIGAGVALPLVVNREAIGVLGLAKRLKDEPFAPSDVELLSVLASQAATAIQNARLFTDLRQAFENLKELDRLKSEFLSNVSHELRAPLHTISGFVQLLLGGKIEDKATQRECLETVARQTENLTKLISDLLDSTKIESGHFELRKASVQMHDVVGQVVRELQPMAMQKQIILSDETAQDLPPVWADAQRMGQVVTNLVQNAVKFTAEHGHVTISSHNNPGQLVIAVQDDGAGIPASAMQHLFERFYQADGSSTRRVGGTGLGLYICEQIVEAHGGRIWVESEEGRGSVFRFSIPTEAGGLDSILMSSQDTPSLGDAQGQSDSPMKR